MIRLPEYTGSSTGRQLKIDGTGIIYECPSVAARMNICCEKVVDKVYIPVVI